MAFVHRGIAHLCSAVTSAAVPTGMGSTLGNKGGVGLYFRIGVTRFLVVNAHLAAHQTAEKRRNAEFNRINKMIPVLLEKRGAQFTSTNPSKVFKEAVKVNEGGSTPLTVVTETPVPSTKDDDAPSVSPEGPAAKLEQNQETDLNPAMDTNCINESNEENNGDRETPLQISINTHSKSHSVDLSAQHVIPSVETIVDKTGHVIGEVDECYTVEATIPEAETEQAAISNADGASEAVAANQTNLAPTLPDQDKNSKPHLGLEDPRNHQNEHSNTEGAVGSAVDLDNTLHSNLDSFTPLATTPTTNRAPGAISTSNSSQAIDTLAEDGGDVNFKNRMDGTAILDVPINATKTLENTADLVVFMGDLNYRIKGNR